MVTTEGESLSPGGSMTGGAFRNNSNLLGRRREIEELETKVNQLKQNLTEMQNAVEEIKIRETGFVMPLQDFRKNSVRNI